MKKIVSNRTHVTHEDEWTRLYRDWAFSRIKEYRNEDLIPASSIYLETIAKSHSSVGIEYVNRFLVEVPKPRPLLVLDNLVGEYFMACTLFYQIPALMGELKAKVFTSPEEYDWYDTHRSLTIAGGETEMTLVIQNWK